MMTAPDTMVITIMRNSKIRFKLSPLTHALILSAAIFAPTGVNGAEVRFTGSLQSELTRQKVNRDAAPDVTLNTISVTPKVGVTARTKKLGASLTATHNYLNRDNNTVAQENNFSTYGATFSYEPVERLLTLTASSNLSYRPANSTNFILSDYLTNSDDLAKTQSNALGLNFNATQGDYIRSDLNLTYSDINADPIGNNVNTAFNALDATNINARLRVASGDEAEIVTWRAQGVYTETDRGEEQYGTFTTQQAQADADIMLLSWLSLRLSGTTEKNETDASGSVFSASREFSTYGAGFTIKQNESRRLSVTYNRTNSNLEESDGENFIGVDLVWAFSSRTSISAQFGRRFYGSSASADFSYNNKHLRSALRYSESATNSSRLLASVESLGVFVCPEGNVDLASCNQPDSLDYTPLPGETLVQFNQNLFDLDDNIIVRKSLDGVIGYSFSKISYNLALQSSEDEFQETGRLRETDSLTFNINYNLSKKTNVSTAFQYANINDDLVDTDTATNNESISRGVTVRINHSIGKKLTAFSSVRLMDRSGSFNAGSVFGPDYSETRLTIGFSYTFL